MGANGFYSTRVCGAFLPFLPFSHKKQYTFKMGMAGDERISAYLEMKNGKNEKMPHIASRLDINRFF